MPPWGLAVAARESLLYGNEHRSARVDHKALTKLMHKFQIAMSLSDEDRSAENLLIRLPTRLMYEQFPYQEPMFDELARSHAWMVEGLSDVETKVITEDSIAAMLDGVPLREAIGATFFLQVGALLNGGVYKQSWLDRSDFVDALKVYSRSSIEKTAARLTTTLHGFRAAFANRQDKSISIARFDYNPLVATPFVDLDDGPVAPSNQLILRTVTPAGLYYAGQAEHGKAFSDDLGGLFEHYIGRQLGLIHDAEVLPEISFGKGGGLKSVDWFVILPQLVILVEVKLRRLGIAERAGDAVLMEKLKDTLGKARTQLTRTVEHLSEGHAAFAAIPTDRPMLGMIVTAEPYYTGPAFLFDQGLSVIPGGSLADIPVAAVSARDIENLVTHGGDVEQLLLAKVAEAGDRAIGLTDLGKKSGVENPILASALDSYPWPARKNPA